MNNKSRNPHNDATAIPRWEGEGGATPSIPKAPATGAALALEEEHILRCLGAAVIMQWSEFSQKIQRDLFQHAIAMGKPGATGKLKSQVARFLHKHKGDPKARS
jgi:hypothetical protein